MTDEQRCPHDGTRVTVTPWWYDCPVCVARRPKGTAVEDIPNPHRHYVCERGERWADPVEMIGGEPEDSLTRSLDAGDALARALAAKPVVQAPTREPLRAALERLRIPQENQDYLTHYGHGWNDAIHAALVAARSVDTDSLARALMNAGFSPHRWFNAELITPELVHSRSYSDAATDLAGMLTAPRSVTPDAKVACHRGSNPAQGIDWHWCTVHDAEWLLSKPACAAVEPQ